MRYKFPRIEHIDQVRSAIAGAEEFFEARRDGYSIFDYRFVTSSSFPDVDPALGQAAAQSAALRREARGLIFDTATGRVLGRRFHKFFNLGERDETRPERLEFAVAPLVLEKLDGSMVSPILLGERLAWTTMLGETEVAAGAARFVAERPQFDRCARELLAAGANPIFEWCSLQNRVVVEHPEPRLVLLAIRGLVDGAYWSFAETQRAAATAGIPMVTPWEELHSDPRGLPERLSQLKGHEGVVLRFDDGHMLKLKTPWYVRIHGVLERLSREADVVEIVLRGEHDDLMPFLTPSDFEELTRFAEALQAGLIASANRLTAKVTDLQARFSSRRDIALALRDDPDAPFIFRMLGGGDPYALVRGHVLRECASGPRLDAARRLFEVRWARRAWTDG
mgnify:CR=1 FL=1